MIEQEYAELSEDETHGSNLLAQAIGQLDKTQHIKPTSKSSISSDNRKVQVKELLSTLGGTADHADIGRKLRNVHRHKFPLSKPIEKKEAEKIRRTTGFDEVKAKLDRWNAIVAKNRAVEHKVFPLLGVEDKKKEPADSYLNKYSIVSDLEKELNSLQPSKEEVEEKHFPLTLSEMIEHRKEAARLRAKQSYKEAKARRQSKIKSKKFHRIQRKEKIKSQLKEFEVLQKTNPEEALKKLEQLEKTRAEERVTLRHKSTGQWAKNKLVRAKYNKETRQELAQQLAISRELTQKISMDNDSNSDEDSGEENPNEKIEDSSNPWISFQTPTNEYANFVSGYKKFWTEQNKVAENEVADAEVENDDSAVNSETISNDIPTKSQKINDSDSKNKQIDKKSLIHSTKQNMTKPKQKKVSHNVISTTDWSVSSSCPDSVEEIFDKYQSNLSDKCSKKINSLKSTLSNAKITKKPMKFNKKEDQDELSKLSFKREKKIPIINEELDEESGKQQSETLNKKELISLSDLKRKISEKNEEITEIDPNKFKASKIRHLQSTVPDIDLGDDHFDDDNQVNDKQMVIAEAFEDDDIVSNFQQEKQGEIDKDKPQIDDAFLPGWGSWTGKNLAPPKRKRKSFLNVFKNLPRKDDKKPNLIIKEGVNEKLKQHLVSELPFPFTSVKDFESTMRAPIGNTFIPETAFKKLTRPAILTKAGVVIKPMDESQLIDAKSRNKNIKSNIENRNRKQKKNKTKKSMK